MEIQHEINKTEGFANLGIIANQVVEGFISGKHKSPFHGYSAEFSEHKIYNPGEGTKHIDWKLFAKTDKLYTKRYEEETNLRAHLILDNSSSMHFPIMNNMDVDRLNKIGFSVLATACIMNILKRQRDAVGLSIYSDQYNYYAPEKGGEKHHRMLLDKLTEVVAQPTQSKRTKTYENLHLIAEKLKRRSLVFLFTDMFQTTESEDRLFAALRHLKYNKHQVVLFHVFDGPTEVDFDFANSPKRFVDVETSQSVDTYADNIKDDYSKKVHAYFRNLKLKCAQYHIKYVAADSTRGFTKILSTYLTEKQSFG